MENINTPITTSQALKLPSADVVTVENLLTFVLALTSSKFTKEQLPNSLKDYAENTSSRVLAYLKYLNYLDESRVNETVAGKKAQIQYYIINKDNPLVADIQYNVKLGRKEEATAKWRQLIAEHPLTREIVKEFFGDDNTKTKIDLENYLKTRDGLSGKAPKYYIYGVTFLTKLLSEAGLISVNGNNINLVSKNIDNKVQDTVSPGVEDVNEPKAKSNKQIYTVTIVGPDLNTSMDIVEILDIVIVKKFLDKISRKLPTSEDVNTETYEDTEPTS